MPKNRIMCVSREFYDFIENIKREFKIKNNTEATRFLMKRKWKMIKGSILDFFPMLLILLIFSVCCLIGYHLLTQIEINFAEQPMIPNMTMDILAIGKSTITYLDVVFIFLIFGLAIAIIIGAFYLNTHPIFLGVGIFILVFIIIVTGVISNVYIEFSEDSTFNTATTYFSVTMLAWQNMPIIILVISVILFIILYSTTSKDRGSGFV